MPLPKRKPPDPNRVALVASFADLPHSDVLMEAFGVPPQLATLLSAFDGLPALGVLSAAEIAREKSEHLHTQVGRRLRWETRNPHVRGNQAWRAGWTPFWTNGSGDYVCIDEDPSASGRKGQIIEVCHDPPSLGWEAMSLGDWLWRRLTAPET